MPRYITIQQARSYMNNMARQQRRYHRRVEREITSLERKVIKEKLRRNYAYFVAGMLIIAIAAHSVFVSLSIYSRNLILCLILLFMALGSYLTKRSIKRIGL